MPETTNPTAIEFQSSAGPPACLAFTYRRPVAANMVGIPTRKANSVAAERSVRPATMAAKIVAAERDVPGKTPERNWQMPTQMATFHVTVALCGFVAT